MRIQTFLPGWCSGEAVEPNHCATGRQFRRLWRYDPSTETWPSRRPAPHFHAFGGAAVIGDKFYVVGSWNRDAFLDVYDPATHTWQTKASIPMPGERLFAAPLQSKLFVLSWSHPTGSPVILKAYLYDPATNTWQERAGPPGVAGPIVNVKLNGQSHLFMPGLQSSYLYAP
jgi:N-acetylneuraminic acid mutarotase